MKTLRYSCLILIYGKKYVYTITSIIQYAYRSDSPRWTDEQTTGQSEGRRKDRRRKDQTGMATVRSLLTLIKHI